MLLLCVSVFFCCKVCVIVFDTGVVPVVCVWLCFRCLFLLCVVLLFVFVVMFAVVSLCPVFVECLRLFVLLVLPCWL